MWTSSCCSTTRWSCCPGSRSCSSSLPLYSLMDVVKIDLTVSPLESIRPAMKQLRRHPARLLAEKVETREQFRDCHDLGFHLFQGYYFARPVTLKHRRIDDGGTTLLTLLWLLMDDADIRKIEEAFRSSPGLTLNLLMLVNSVGFGVPPTNRDRAFGIAMLGRQQMHRWVQLAPCSAPAAKARGAGRDPSAPDDERAGARGPIACLYLAGPPSRSSL